MEYLIECKMLRKVVIFDENCEMNWSQQLTFVSKMENKILDIIYEVMIILLEKQV